MSNSCCLVLSNNNTISNIINTSKYTGITSTRCCLKCLLLSSTEGTKHCILEGETLLFPQLHKIYNSMLANEMQASEVLLEHHGFTNYDLSDW